MGEALTDVIYSSMVMKDSSASSSSSRLSQEGSQDESTYCVTCEDVDGLMEASSS